MISSRIRVERAPLNPPLLRRTTTIQIGSNLGRDIWRGLALNRTFACLSYDLTFSRYSSSHVVCMLFLRLAYCSCAARVGSPVL